MAENGGVKRFVVQIPSAAETEVRCPVREEPFNSFRSSSSTIPAASSSERIGGLQQPTSSQSGRQGQGQEEGGNTTFTEAFSFLRNTKFYSPPPPPRQPGAAVSSAAPIAPGSDAVPYSQTSNFKKEEGYAGTAQTGQPRNAILVSRRQQGNSVLKHIRNARWMFSDIVPDYILGQNSCALYLSLRYHLLHPDYIYFRIRELQKNFRLRIVLCHVDVDDVVKPLHEVTKTCLLHDCSLLCAWSQVECARYLETIKIYENKPADGIQERTDSDYLSRLQSSLTTVRHVNKTDVVTLGSTFKTLTAIFNASMEDLAKCPGIGERKVKRLYDAFNEPFRRNSASKPSKQKIRDKSLLGTPGGHAFGTGGPTGQTLSEDHDNGNKEVERSSKLINREGEVSIRDALNAVRKMSSTSSDKEAQGGSDTFRDKTDANSTDRSQLHNPKKSLELRVEEEHVVSLND